MTYTPRTREGLIQGLRDLADFLEANPEVPAPTSNFLWLSVPLDTVEEAKEIVKGAAKTGGKWNKRYYGSRFELQRYFGPGEEIDFAVSIGREEVCRKKVIGTQIVTKEVPASNETKTVEVEEPIIEWECDPLLKEE